MAVNSGRGLPSRCGLNSQRMIEDIAGMAASAHKQPVRDTAPHIAQAARRGNRGRRRLILACVTACGRDKGIQFAWLKAAERKIKTIKLGKFERQQLVMLGRLLVKPVVGEAIGADLCGTQPFGDMDRHLGVAELLGCE